MIRRRLALLVDGDNLSAKYAALLLSEAEKRGRVDVSRVYTSATTPSGWLTAPGFRLMHAGGGKNAADLLLSIDAMELALRSGIESFLIASSDGDMTHLAQRLREHGLDVLGMGEAKAPQGFRLACTQFMLLPAGVSASIGHCGRSGISELDRKIREMIASHSRGGRGMRIVDLAPKMHAAHGTKISGLPERNWRAYLSGRPALFEVDPRGPEAMVRFRPEGFAAG